MITNWTQEQERQHNEGGIVHDADRRSRHEPTQPGVDQEAGRTGQAEEGQSGKHRKENSLPDPWSVIDVIEWTPREFSLSIFC